MRTTRGGAANPPEDTGATISSDADTDETLIPDRKVAVLGYGSQGHAHALNLRDSGIDVRVGLRAGSASRAVAEEQGLRVLDTNEAADEADVIVVLAPDTAQKGMWAEGLSEAVREGDALIFGHGFNVHFGFVAPHDGVDTMLVAPKSPGHIVRRMYEQGQGVQGLVSVPRDASGGALESATSNSPARVVKGSPPVSFS